MKALMFILALALVSCSDDLFLSSPVVVTITEEGAQPLHVECAEGERVTFENGDDEAHFVDFWAPMLADPGEIAPGESVSVEAALGDHWFTVDGHLWGMVSGLPR